MSSMGERIRARRREIGFSQEEMARRATKTLNTMNRIEVGAVDDPSLSTLRGIAEALDTSVAWIIGEKEHNG